MLDLLKAIKDKYRIFLVTQVDQADPDKGDYKRAKEALQAEIDFIPHHCLMYCTTFSGKVAMIRQMGADLHMDSKSRSSDSAGDLKLVESLH